MTTTIPDYAETSATSELGDRWFYTSSITHERVGTSKPRQSSAVRRRRAPHLANTACKSLATKNRALSRSYPCCNRSSYSVKTCRAYETRDSHTAVSGDAVLRPGLSLA